MQICSTQIVTWLIPAPLPRNWKTYRKCINA
jgi:hypothetical protein